MRRGAGRRAGRRGARRVAVSVGVAALSAVGVLVAPDVASAREVLPFEVETTEEVGVPLEDFRAHVVETLADPRGWALGGTVDFELVDDGGLFTVVLASPAEVAAAAPICSADWSCRVGRRVLVNEERWNEGTLGYPLPLDDYRHYVVNHEVGHWLGLDHRDCPGFDEPAPVMMQQSKSVDECNPTIWPIPDEQQRAAELRGVDVARQAVLSLGDRGAGAAEWQQHLNEITGADLVVDGWFGPRTEAATDAYQRFFGMDANGVAGEDERVLMNYLLRVEPRRLTIGMLGPDVTDWQRSLRQAGQGVVVDGWFGPQTRDRTQRLQRFFDLPMTGEADRATRELVDVLVAIDE